MSALSLDQQALDQRAAEAAVAARPHDPIGALMGDPRTAPFSPALVEVAEGAPSRLLLWMPTAALGMLGVLVAWAALASVDIVSQAPGRVVPSARVKMVQPAEGGVVRAIHVANGDTVRAGAPVLDLDPAEVGVDVDQLSRRLVAARLEAAAARAELEAEAEGASGGGAGGGAGGDALARFAVPPGAAPETAERRRGQLAGDVAAMRVRVAAADGEIQRLKAARAAIAAQAAKVEAVLPLLRERVETRAYLVDRNLTARSELLALRQELVQLDHERGILRQQIAQADADVSLAEERRRQLLAERRAELLRRLAEQEELAGQVAGELDKATQRQARRRLLAPVDGVVADLAVFTVGGVVREADALMKIVPEDDRLEVEARVKNRDVGFVRAGQTVAVKVDTFTFTRYGTLEGRVLDLSADSASDDPQNGTYKARIALARETMTIDGAAVRLTPGMTVTVDIRTGARTVLDYLLTPMLRITNEALRER